MTDEPRDTDLGALPAVWEAIDRDVPVALAAERESSKTMVLNAAAIDRAQPAGHRVYISANRLLRVAHENHLAYLSLIQAHGIGPTASFNLLRPVLESSMWCLWLLQPDDGKTRRRRGLWFEIQDVAAKAAYLDELGMMADSREYRDAAAQTRASLGPDYDEEARTFGTTARALRGERVNLTTEIPKLGWLATVFGDDWPRITAAEWRRLSAFQHGKSWPGVLGSDRKVTAKIQGGVEVHMTPTDSSIQIAGAVAGLGLLGAARLLLRRCTRTD